MAQNTTTEFRKWIQETNNLGSRGIPFLFVVDYDMSKPLCFTLDAIPPHISFSFRENSISSSPIALRFKEPDISAYQAGYEIIQKHIARGDSYLVNYTVEIEIDNTHSLRQIYAQAHAKYKLIIDNQFVLFSPETFITISEGGTIATYPMKGTKDAAADNAHSSIIADCKEAAEHATVVDLLRNDLSRVAHSVRVSRYRYVEEILTPGKKLLQVSSQIEGQLPKEWKSMIGNIISQVLPAGSITGAPKAKTLDIISEAETHRRGYYTGVCGIFDGNELDSAVMIRFIEERDGKLYYKSGGGITSQSKMTEEYNEVKQKVYVPIN